MPLSLGTELGRPRIAAGRKEKGTVRGGGVRQFSPRAESGMDSALKVKASAEEKRERALSK